MRTRLSRRVIGTASLALLAVLGCGGQSKTTFDDSVSQGGAAASGATGGVGGSTGGGGAGGSSASVGSGGAGATGGSSAAGGTGGTVSGTGGTVSGTGGTVSGAGGTAGSAVSGAGGTVSGAGGDAGSAGASAGASGSPSGPSIIGEWGMFWFEDPVVVAISQDGSALSGTGCCGGFTSISLCCGPLMGTRDDQRASFSFLISDFGGVVYGSSVFISADAMRMGGTFTADGNKDFDVAWVRVDEQVGTLGSPPSALREALGARAGTFQLLLESELVDRFQPLTAYQLSLGSEGFIRGDFGPFYFGEMNYDEVGDTLVVGPVPETDPRFATKLELRFQAGELTNVVATYPGESPYFFHASR